MPVLNRDGEPGPHDFLRFVETNEFSDDWQSLDLDVEYDLWDL